MSVPNVAGAIALIVGYPFVTLAHELAHAVAALRFTSGPVRIHVGVPSASRTFRRGRLTVALSFVGIGGVCLSDAREMPRREAMIQILAGPAANLALAIPLIAAAFAAHGAARGVLIALAALNAEQLVMNLIPRRGSITLIHDGATDGLRAVCLWRRRPLPRPKGTKQGSVAGWSEPLTVAQAVQVTVGLGAGAVLLASGVTPAEMLPWSLPGIVIGWQARQTIAANREAAAMLAAQQKIADLRW